MISDSITREVGICENVVYKSLDDALDEWADAALSADRIGSSASARDLKGSGYEINSELPGFVRLVFGCNFIETSLFYFLVVLLSAALARMSENGKSKAGLVAAWFFLPPSGA